MIVLLLTTLFITNAALAADGIQDKIIDHGPNGDQVHALVPIPLAGQSRAPLPFGGSSVFEITPPPHLAATVSVSSDPFLAGRTRAMPLPTAINTGPMTQLPAPHFSPIPPAMLEPSAQPLLQGAPVTSYASAEVVESRADERVDPEENTPKRHPILSRSRCARWYVENSAICCFFGRGWFKTGAFLGGVATTAIAGLAYGVSDPTLKDQLGLALLILTIATPALKKFEDYANREVRDDEDEYKMFLPESAAQRV